MVTRESNDEFMERFALRDVVDMIAAPFVRVLEKSAPDFERLPELERCRQWRDFLRANFMDIAPGAMGVRAGPGSHSAPPPAKLVPVDLVAEQFLCNECGFAFATQAALSSHQYKMHYEEEKKAQRKEEIQQQQQQSATDHSLDGMPTCKHCLHQFETWPAFTYHVNSRSCVDIRRFFSDTNVDVLAGLSEALMLQDDMVQLAADLSWQQLATHPRVQNSLRHCMECHHWSVEPTYVRRHMKAKRADTWWIVQAVAQSILDLALSSPCKYCGAKFSQRRQRLRSCPAIFNGHYLKRRLSLKPHLPSTIAFPSGNGSSGGGNEGVGSHSGFDARLDSAGGCNNARSSSLGTGRRAANREDGQGRGGSRRGSGKGIKMVQARQQRSQSQRQGKLGEFFRKLKFVAKTELASGSGRECPHPGPQATSRAPEHADSTPRQPDHDKPPGHSVRVFHAHGLPQQPGGLDLYGGQGLEGNQGQCPGKAEPPSEGYVISARVDDNSCTSGSTGERTSTDRKCQEAGLGDGGWYTEVDPAIQKVPMQAAKGMLLEAVTLAKECYTSSFRGISKPNADIQSGSGPENSGGQSYLADSEQPVPNIDMGGGRNFLQARETPTLGSGNEDCSRLFELLRRVKFGNSGFHCYTNATMRCLLWTMRTVQVLRDQMDLDLCRIIEGAWTSDTFHFWDNVVWKAKFFNWRDPHSQHDVGEFLRYLLGKCPRIQHHFQFHWEARRAHGSGLETVQILDAADSVILVLDSNIRDADNSLLETVTIQQLIHEWECQESTHGFSPVPEKLATLAGRFQMVDGRLVKRHVHIIPNQKIYIPTYAADVFCTSGFRFNSYIEHGGEDLHSGHYTAVLHFNNTMWKADDNATRSLMNEQQVRDGFSRTYMFFYNREVL